MVLTRHRVGHRFDVALAQVKRSSDNISRDLLADVLLREPLRAGRIRLIVLHVRRIEDLVLEFFRDPPDSHLEPTVGVEAGALGDRIHRHFNRAMPVDRVRQMRRAVP